MVHDLYDSELPSLESTVNTRATAASVMPSASCQIDQQFWRA
jgi:hypothetical protein